MNRIKSFLELSSFDAKRQFEAQIKKKIESQPKEYILQVEEDEYKSYLIDEFSLEPLQVFKESELIHEPNTITEKVSRYPRPGEFEREVYLFTVEYQFSGSPILFQIQPSLYTHTHRVISVFEGSNKVVLSFKLHYKDPAKFKIEKNTAFREAFANLENVNKFAEQWNTDAVDIVNKYYDPLKKKYLEENSFFAAINVATNKSSEPIYTVPIVKKKKTPKPALSEKIQYSNVPTVSESMYGNILEEIYTGGQKMEQKTSLYKGKDEEGIRDQLLFLLQSRFPGTTATGETFNSEGRSDIIVKNAADNSNLFVAECKFWKGASEYHKAINQLFDKYLTWRDSKTALILFVKNKDFTNVLETVIAETPKHGYFTRTNGRRGETSISYFFRLPSDAKKRVFFEVILFHFEKWDN